jgi:hypothetical protein
LTLKLPYPPGGQVRVVEVVALAKRRGTASEARALYFERDEAEVPHCNTQPCKLGQTAAYAEGDEA